MGFIIDLLFIPIKLITYPISAFLGWLVGSISASIEIHFFKKRNPHMDSSFDYEEDDEYQYTQTKQRLDELAKQINEMGKS